MDTKFNNLSIERPTPRGVKLHPQDHSPKVLAQQNFDVVVIGSGPAGRGLAAKTAAEGLSTIVVEEELFGGDCPFWACIPSKALLRPAETLAAARQVSGAAQLVSKDRIVDVEAVFERRDKFTQKWDDKWLIDLSTSQKCSIVRGRGALAGEKKVIVKNVNGEETSITVNHAVILATGSEPVIPDIPGLSDILYWTPREATSANKVPGHLIIIGAGAVGTEMATAYAMYGSQVTLISSTSEILSTCEPQAGKMVREALEASKVKIYLSAKPKKVSNEGDNKISVTLSTGETISGTTLLIATGRRPRTSELGLEHLHVQLPLTVDNSLCVSSEGGKWLYAIGDTNGLSPMTHMGGYQARIAANTIIARAKSQNIEALPWSSFANTANDKAVSQIIFTDPNVAFVGLTLVTAQKKGIKVKTVSVPFQFPGAFVHAEFNYDGWAQWVIDEEKDVLIGATFVGREAGDLLHASTVAIVGEVPIERLRHAVPSFPTMSEIYTALLAAI